MERQILHIDCNKFYASVECYLHPELRDKPVAVGGCEESRHGIILTKNEIASKYNLVVGEPLWKARQKCPDLIIVPPHFPTYIEFSQKVRNILEDYTDLIEPFGLDESWIDVTGDWYKSGEEIAYEINRRVREEIGITVSIGVSFNKIFAKLGSDYKKPDAVTIITKDNYKDIVWPLPCSDLLMVGPATTRKLNYYGIKTIGDLACADMKFIKSILGKNGEMLKRNAMGLDTSPVRHMDLERDIKSIGNSTTTPRDLVNDEDVKIVLTVLADSVARRMREHNLKGTTVSIYVRDRQLQSFTRQKHLSAPTNVTEEITKEAFALFQANYIWNEPIRSVGVSMTDFDFETEVQFDLSKTVEKRERMEQLDKTVDRLKNRYGNYCIQPATALIDTELSHFNPFEEHIIHPVSPM
ncbi:MAG: DNA polymerase IV [Eubacteriales bacterium]|nr:DNA polymerase IV [Eubacteriales bacterium]